MDVNELLRSIDLVELASQFTDLTEKNGEWWGLSPLKDEKTPSFSVRRETNSFYDFSSGIGGSAITLLMHYYHISAAEAIEKLKNYANIDGTIENFRPRLQITSVCKQFLPKKPHAQQKSTVLPENYMERFEDAGERLKIWEDEGISAELLKEFGVKYDALSNRLVYPIYNEDGELVNIGGRTLFTDYKERNTPKYIYFMSWGANGLNVIYGLNKSMDSVLKKREIILFEGMKSVLKAIDYGFSNVGAILTSHLNPEQAKILIKLGVRVVFALDKEINIRKDRNISKLRNYMTVETIYDRDNLIDLKDSPADKGAEIFKKLYEGRVRYR